MLQGVSEESNCVTRVNCSVHDTLFLGFKTVNVSYYGGSQLLPVSKYFNEHCALLQVIITSPLRSRMNHHPLFLDNNFILMDWKK